MVARRKRSISCPPGQRLKCVRRYRRRTKSKRRRTKSKRRRTKSKRRRAKSKRRPRKKRQTTPSLITTLLPP